MKKTIIALVLLSLLSLSVIGQRPSIFLSKNTISSIIQDQSRNRFSKLEGLSDFIFLAPSYCYIDSSKVQFTQIISKTEIDYNAFDILNNCGNLESVKSELSSTGNQSFLIISGILTSSNGHIITTLKEALGSDPALSDLAKNEMSGKVISDISTDDLKVLFNEVKFENLRPQAKFLIDGIALGVSGSDLAIIEKADRTQLTEELQATGITSIATYLPLEFVNDQLSKKVFPYTDAKGTAIQIKESRFIIDDQYVRFETILSGSSLQNRTMKNTYKVVASLDRNNLLLEKIKIRIESGNDKQEESYIQAIFNGLENTYRYKLLFAIPNDKNFLIGDSPRKVELNLRTYYAHVFADNIMLINSFKLKK